jgi:hypothetical protein
LQIIHHCFEVGQILRGRLRRRIAAIGKSVNDDFGQTRFFRSAQKTIQVVAVTMHRGRRNHTENVASGTLLNMREQAFYSDTSPNLFSATTLFIPCPCRVHPCHRAVADFRVAHHAFRQAEREPGASSVRLRARANQKGAIALCLLSSSS